MASLVYKSSIVDVLAHDIDFDADSFKFMLVDATYVPNAQLHSRRSDVSGEVAGAGYAAGGEAVTATVVRDVVNDVVDVQFSPVIWPMSSIDARGGVLYKARGLSPAEDELVAYIDFGSNRISTTGIFSVVFSSPYRFRV